MNVKMTHHAVIQVGYAIFGVGESEQDAIENARQWVDDPDALDDLPDAQQANDGDMVVVECSAALAAEVAANGTCLWHDLSRTGICLPSELDD